LFRETKQSEETMLFEEAKPFEKKMKNEKNEKKTG
jgi:hypothetical protein